MPLKKRPRKKPPSSPPRKKPVSELTPKEARKLWEQEEKLKQRESRPEAFEDTGTSYRDERRNIAADEKDFKDAWQQLIASAKVRFPESLADRFDISPNKKLAVVAHVQGWSLPDIAKASGFHYQTVWKWINKDPAVQAFMEAVEYYLGSKDGKEMIDREIFPSILVLKDLRDDPKVPAGVRQSVAQWFFEQKYGKSKERKEVTGISVADLTKEIQKLKKESAEEIAYQTQLEEELDNEVESNE